MSPRFLPGLQSLWPALPLLAAACAGAESGPSPVDSSPGAASSRAPRSVVEATHDDAPVVPSAAACQSYRDVVVTDKPQISLRNTGSVTLFVSEALRDCGKSPSLVEVLRDGQQLTFEPHFCRGGPSCAEYLDGEIAGPALQDKRGGCWCGGLAGLRVLEPQQVLRQTVELELAPRELPASCSGESGFTTIPCVARVLPATGNYMLRVSAFTQLACEPLADAGPDGDPTAHCACQPDSSGRCSNPAFSRSVSEQPLTFTLATSNYFQDLELELSAPDTRLPR